MEEEGRAAVEMEEMRAAEEGRKLHHAVENGGGERATDEEIWRR